MKKDVKKLLSAVEQKLVRRLHERPSRETLDHLALFVGFQDWESFQKELHEGDDIPSATPTDNSSRKTSEPSTGADR